MSSSQGHALYRASGRGCWRPAQTPGPWRGGGKAPLQGTTASTSTSLSPETDQPLGLPWWALLQTRGEQSEPLPERQPGPPQPDGSSSSLGRLPPF